MTEVWISEPNLFDNNKREIIGDLDRFEWIYNEIKPHLDSNETILDVGCGDALLWKRFNLLGHKNVTLFDIDLYDYPNFIRGDAHDLPFEDNSYDVVILAEVLEHVDDPIKVLKEAKRVVRKKVIVTIPDENNWISLYKPFTPIEDVLIELGVNLKEHARVSNPEVKEFHKDLTHLHHKRHYNEELVKTHLELAGIDDYRIDYLMYDGWAFWCIVVEEG